MAIALSIGVEVTAAGSPFDDAVAVWRMGRLEAGARNAGKLACVGDVKLDVELRESERKASLQRGGDGRVAEFNGGHLIASGPDGQPLELTGGEMTLCVRVRDPQGKWNTPLFARQVPDDSLANLLYCGQIDRAYVGAREAGRIGEGRTLEFRWRTLPAADSVIPQYFEDPWYKGLISCVPRVNDDFLKGVLNVSAPIELIGPDKWHDVVVRFKGPNLEMFIDGVLLDEEWPHGDLHMFRGPFLIGAGYKDGQLTGGFHGQIDHAALWQRALRDEEIVVLCGGKKEVARRDAEILGPESTSLQYSRPRGYNAFVGDCMPFWDGTRLHVYYIFVRRNLESKWLAVGGGFGHVSTKDLVHWEQHPMALSITDPTECALGTGQFLYHNGKYYLFYVQHGRRIKWKDSPYQGDKIFLATSTDGVHFQKQPGPLCVMDYLTGNDMNPSVWPDESGRRWIMNVSGLKVFASTDLLNWKETSELPWLQEGTFFRGAICTSYFRWNDWYYFCNPGLYRKSREPMEAGKWETVDRHDLIIGGICVPEVVRFGKNRFLWVGFGEGSYGQELVIRELVQNPDGTLGMKFPAEMIPAGGEPLKLAFEPLRGNATGNAGTVRIEAKDGVGIAMLKDLPQNVRITLRVKPTSGVKYFGLTLRGKGNYEDGCELRFDPAKRRAQYGVPEKGGLAKEYEGEYIENLDRLDRPFVLDVIVKDDFVDACIDSRRAILKRQYSQGDRLFLFAYQGEAVFEDISVRQLVGQQAFADATTNNEY